jgi:hypothetical protein
VAAWADRLPISCSTPPGIVVWSNSAFAKQPDFPSRVETTINAALTYWGGSWKNLDGATTSFEGSQHVQCVDKTSAVGCSEDNIHVSTRDYGFT